MVVQVELFVNGCISMTTTTLAPVLRTVSCCFPAVYKLFIYLCLNVAKRNETKDKWFLEFPSTSAFVGSVF